MFHPLLAINNGCNSLLPDLYKDLRTPPPGCNSLDPAKLSSFDAILTLLRNVVQIALSLAALVAIAMVIVGGIMYITSNGNPSSITRAKDTLVNWLIGLIIVIGAYALVGLIASGVH